MSQRAIFPDALRGAALLGIGIVNLPFIAAPLTAQPPVLGTGDAAVAAGIALLLQGKMYLIFALLFGFGAATAWRHPDAPARMRRRAAGLLLFGVAHAMLVFVGDILMLYALLSLLLLRVVGAPPAALHRTMRVTLVVAAIGFLLLTVIAVSLGPPEAMAAANGHAGSFADGVRQRLSELVWVIPFGLLFNGPLAFAAMLAGIAAARAGLMARPALLAATVSRRRWLLVALALLGNAVFAATATRSDAWFLLALPALLVGAPAGACVWLMLASRSLAGHGRMLSLLAAAGRMSLTIYLGQGIVANVLFAGWGLGWFGSVGSAALLGVAAGVWLALALAASLWLRHFAEGPDEWLLRCIAAGRWRPFPRAAAHGAIRPG